MFEQVEQLHNYHKIPSGSIIEVLNNETNDTVGKEEIKEEVLQLKNETDLVDSECGLCRLKVPDINSHIEQYHPGNGEHYCVLCSREQSSTYATTKQLTAHLKYHR